jgi:hypothetical protein
MRHEAGLGLGLGLGLGFGLGLGLGLEFGLGLGFEVGFKLGLGFGGFAAQWAQRCGRVDVWACGGRLFYGMRRSDDEKRLATDDCTILLLVGTVCVSVRTPRYGWTDR